LSRHAIFAVSGQVPGLFSASPAFLPAILQPFPQSSQHVSSKQRKPSPSQAGSPAAATKAKLHCGKDGWVVAARQVA
jgi:hypothetical protein